MTLSYSASDSFVLFRPLYSFFKQYLENMSAFAKVHTHVGLYLVCP